MKRILLLLLLFLHPAIGFANERFEVLEVEDQRYFKVVVLSSNEASLSIRHSRGIAQVPLAKLSPELQLKFGYDASAAAARNEKLNELKHQQNVAQEQRIRKAVATAQQGIPRSSTSSSGGGLQSAFVQFGSEPHVAAEHDLRPLFRQHGIYVRKQRGPSCSVHAIVAALEYQYAEKQGKRINVSETHLVQATSRTLGRNLVNDLSGTAESTRDEGFALEHVFQAIRGYGLRVQSTDPAVSQESFEEAFRDVNVSPFSIPGGRSRLGIGNIVHVLNADMPVVIGVAWPAFGRVANTSLISKQPPAEGAGHAVTIVGYRCETGELEDTKFIFRNSWGARWGAGGYGFVTYEYLVNNLTSAYVVELR